MNLVKQPSLYICQGYIELPEKLLVCLCMGFDLQGSQSYYFTCYIDNGKFSKIQSHVIKFSAFVMQFWNVCNFLSWASPNGYLISGLDSFQIIMDVESQVG